jgi:hypothetical protein
VEEKFNGEIFSSTIVVVVVVVVVSDNSTGQRIPTTQLHLASHFHQ